jgi:nitrous oxidase accessory protein
VPAEPGALAEAIAGASPGDVLILAPGRHDGPVALDRTLTLDGRRRGAGRRRRHRTVITVTGDDVTVRGLEIRGSGRTITRHRCRASSSPHGASARGRGQPPDRQPARRHVHGARDSVVRGNVIEGRQDHRMNDRGNGVYVWNAPGTVVEGNDIRWGRDGIFANASRDNTFRDNLFRDLRFAVHYMYTNNSEVSGNVSVGNTWAMRSCSPTGSW